MTRFVLFVSSLVFCVVTFFSFSDVRSSPMTIQAKSEQAIIQTNLGKIVIQFYDTDAPKHVDNFKKLARDGFYNGLTFHRVIQGFMIQGGDPKGDGTGGPSYTIPAEIKRTHKRGAVAAARLGDGANPTRASSGSQFYICDGNPSFLDGQYSVFGEVIEGLDVVDKIAAVKKDMRDRPLEPVVMQSVTIEAR